MCFCQTTLNKFCVHIPSYRFSQKTLCFANILTFFYQHVNNSLRAQLILPPNPLPGRFFYELLFIGSPGLNKSVFIWITGRSLLGFKKAQRHGGVRQGVPDEDNGVAQTADKSYVREEWLASDQSGVAHQSCVAQRRKLHLVPHADGGEQHFKG